MPREVTKRCYEWQHENATKDKKYIPREEDAERENMKVP